MSSDDKWSDDETWDSVADGPVSPEQLAELVAVCEQRPELWKRCALVLLEEQTLRHELQQMARGQLTYKPAKPAALPTNTPLPCPAPLEQASATGSLRGGASTRTLLWNNLALAASVLIVFGIGWQASQRFGGGFQRVDNPSAVELSGAGEVPQNDSLAHSLPEDRKVQDGLGRPSYAQIDEEMIDQVNAETLASTMQSDWNENLDPEYQQLRREGYEVEAQKGLMPVWLYDGSSAVVPYEQIIVRPKSKSRNY